MCKKNCIKFMFLLPINADLIGKLLHGRLEIRADDFLNLKPFQLTRPSLRKKYAVSPTTFSEAFIGHLLNIFLKQITYLTRFLYGGSVILQIWRYFYL